MKVVDIKGYQRVSRDINEGKHFPAAGADCRYQGKSKEVSASAVLSHAHPRRFRKAGSATAADTYLAVMDACIATMRTPRPPKGPAKIYQLADYRRA